MIFSSLEFVCVFLPIVFLLYCLMPSIQLKNALLIIASLLFYAYGEPVYVLLMIMSAFFNWMFAWMMDQLQKKRWLLLLDVVLNIGCLVFFKYTVFFISVWNQFSGMHITPIKVTMPIGISFFTFQALSYVIDVYRGTVPVQKNFFKVLLYISFFPQLIAGPIVKYQDIEKMLSKREQSATMIVEGMQRFVCGLAKKVLIANTMGQVCDTLFGNTELNIFSAWFAAITYMMQIYYDFSGYSDMAIGLGKMFGFTFRENFRYPYGADSIREFWRRWHISLSSWFKEYVYIPLGGNRKGKIRTGVNKFFVFFLTGLWHGANWTFILWGIYHGLLSMLEEYTSFTKKMPKVLLRIYTFAAVCIGFVIFRAEDISQARYMIGQMFTGTVLSSYGIQLLVSQLSPWVIFILVVAIFLMAPVKPLVIKINQIIAEEKKQESGKMQRIVCIFSLVILLWCIIRLSGSTYNPFIYFRF